MSFERILFAVLLILTSQTVFGQTVQDRLKVLEDEIRRMQQELDQLKRDAASPQSVQEETLPAESPTKTINREFFDQVIVPDLGADEREHQLEGRPEVFLQNRFSRNLVDGADLSDTQQNFQLTRIETRWSGRISQRIGAGLEMQFHPAPGGSPEEIVNDAFLEFYPANGLTLRAGQFVKPFGFDVQQSSSEREYPERAMFEGYFFPGERDRGVMLRWDLRNTTVSAAILNGNRFFADFDKRVNTVLRIRRLLPASGLAVGVSAEVGSQSVPPGISGNSDLRIFGLDLQYTVRRFGTRLELIRGTRPSTVLSREPEFTEAFVPGSHTSGVAFSGLFRLTESDQLYARYDTVFGDPMIGDTVRATNAGYLRFIGERARIGVNYQWKNRPTFNDDAVNTKFQTTLGIVF
jgi:Phosphate-selective porin O and P